MTQGKSSEAAPKPQAPLSLAWAPYQPSAGLAFIRRSSSPLAGASTAG